VTLTDEQRRILAHRSGPLRIAAGAGTGKTDTLRRAIVGLIEDGVSPGEILCLTFTVEATKEMRRRALDALAGREGIDPDELTVQTYHAFAASILREHALLLGLDPDSALLDRARQWQLALEALDGCSSFDDLEIGWLANFVDKLLTLNEELQRHVVSPDELRAWCRAHDADKVARERLEAIEAIECYRALKLERHAIDFGDQIELAVRLLDEQPQVLERLAARFRYVFLDEYQDTDVAQRELVRRLGTRAELVCAVGDVDQGIFGWRGATIHNMFAFPDDFPGARKETLSVNFRSGPAILELANALIEPWQREGRATLRPAEGAPDATVEAFVSPHQLDEAEEMAKRIQAGGEPWNRYAVLMRTRGLFNPIYRALVARGVPVEVDTLGGFWTRPEILDVLAWLRLLADPGDNLALGRLLLGPAYRLSLRDLFFLADRAKDEKRRQRYGDRDVLPFELVDSIVAHAEIEELSEEARERLESFRATWRELAGIAERVSLADLVGEVARVSGLVAELAGSPNPEADLALRHLAKLRDLAQGYQPVAGSLDLAGFVSYLETVDESDQDEDELRAVEENAVRLLTLHRAKGLEFDVVFLPGLTKGQMPHPGKGGNNPSERWQRLPFELRGDRDFLPEPPTTKEQLDLLRDEEERRLMYVGITRARRRLVLSRAWYYRDNAGPKDPSPFWEEAVATELVAPREVPCPDENPQPLGIEQPPEAERRFEPPPPDETEIARIGAELERLRAVEARRAPAVAERAPTTLSVTAFLTFVRDPEEFFWRYVRRVPSPPSPAAKLGIELHRRIELHARASAGVAAAATEPEEQEPYDLDVGERRGDGSGVSAEQMWQNYLNSRFAKMKPLMTEQPFTLYLGHGVSVTGRIDTIVERADGSWEILDYKSGATEPDPLQLAIYGRAVEEIWARQPHASWLLLRDGSEKTAPALEDLHATLQCGAKRLAENSGGTKLVTG
jgi:DNA helicase II / ATP-dependent DNA helicase PcrA